MFKKFISGTIVLVLILGLSISAYANPDNNTTDRDRQIVEQPETFFRLTNIPRNMVTNDPNLYISFSATEKATVLISVFHNVSLANDEEKFVLINDPLKIEVGTLQRGFAEVTLRRGRNRIEFKINFDNGEEMIVTRNVTLTWIEEVKKLLTENLQTAKDAIRNIFIATENLK